MQRTSHSENVLRVALLLLVGTAIFGGLAMHAQEARPDFTGSWQLNLAKSRRAFPRSGNDDSYDIKHHEPKLDMRHHFEGRIESCSFTVDGKERLATLGPDWNIRAKAMWNGNSLVIEKQQEVARGMANWTSRYTLSEDGKHLIITHQVKMSALGGPFDERLVYDKK